MQSTRIARRSQVRQVFDRLRGKRGDELILVADNHRAILFQNKGPRRKPEMRTELTHEEGRLPAHELASDRAGRTVDSWTASGAGPHGSSARHGYGGENNDPKEQESLRWAQRVARWVEGEQRGNDSLTLTLVAEPRFLGRLRHALPDRLKKRIRATHSHDFAKLEGAELLERLAKLPD